MRGSWVTTSTPREGPLGDLGEYRHDRFTVRAVEAAVGSSASTADGFPTMARAMATRCCSPPLSSRGNERILWPSPTTAMASLAYCSRHLRRLAADVRAQGGHYRLPTGSETDDRTETQSQHARALAWRDPPARGRPLTGRRPDGAVRCGVNMHPRTESSVVFPLPTAPSAAQVRHRQAISCTPLRACTSPRPRRGIDDVRSPRGPASSSGEHHRGIDPHDLNDGGDGRQHAHRDGEEEQRDDQGRRHEDRQCEIRRSP